MITAKLFKYPLATSQYKASVSLTSLKCHYTPQVLITVVALPDDAASAAVLEGFHLPCDDWRGIAGMAMQKAKWGDAFMKLLISLVPEKHLGSHTQKAQF